MNCIYYLPCFCSDSNDKISFHVWDMYLTLTSIYNSKDTLNFIQSPSKNLLTFSSKYQKKPLCGAFTVRS